MNKEMNEKNQKIMELLDLIEDLKIQVYARDKTVDIQQSQLQELFEDLRDAKQFEHKCKTMQIMNNSLQKENTRLKLELEVKITSDVTTEMTTAEGKMEKETLAI
jgi:serine protease inhibitor ecotin